MRTDRILAILGLSLTLLLPIEAAGAGDGDGWGSETGDHSTTISGQEQAEEVQDIVHGGVGNDGTWTPPSKWPEYTYVPTCSHNTPEGGADALCNGATRPCATRQEHAIQMWVFRRTVFADGREPTRWERVATICKGPDDDRPTTPVVTTEMVVQAARAMAPQVRAHVEPEAQSYVHFPNNYYADTPNVTRTVTLFGHSIAVRFTAGETTWDFGDDSTATGNGIKGADVGQSGSVEHAYARQGDYSVTASATYTVSFTLPDGRDVTQEVAGVPGPAAELEIGEIQSIVTDVD